MKPKKVFETVFDPSMQPGYETRYKSMSSLMGKPMRVRQTTNAAGEIFRNDDLRTKFKSALVEQTLPSIKLRKEGKY